MKLSDYFKTFSIEAVHPFSAKQYVAYISNSDQNLFYVAYFCSNKLMPYRHPSYPHESRYSYLHKTFPITERL